MEKVGGALTTPRLTVHLNDIVSANKVLLCYTQWVISQSDIQSSSLVSLAVHQQAARKHARYWQENLQPVTQQIIAEISRLSRVFLEKLTSLQQIIAKGKIKNKNGINEFVTIIKYLKSNLVVNDHNNQEIIAKLESFYSKLSHDERNFNSDLSEAQDALIGDEEELKVLQKQLRSIDKAINRDKVLVEGGFLLIWVAVGGAIDLEKQKKAKQSTEVKMTVKRQELMALNAAKQQINGFVKSVEIASQATAMLQEGWNALKVDLEEVVMRLEKLTPQQAVEYLTPLLVAAKKDWQIFYDEAEKLKAKVNADCCPLQFPV